MKVKVRLPSPAGVLEGKIAATGPADVYIMIAETAWPEAERSWPRGVAPVPDCQIGRKK